MSTTLTSRPVWSRDSLQPDGPRYLAVVERIARDIDSGALREGMRLPPQRALAARLGVDLTTVSRAYAEAQRRGLVTGHVGRGTFVRRRLMPSGAAAGQSTNDATVDLSRNFPTAVVLELAEQALATTLEALPGSPSFSGLLDYQAHAGRLDHREAGLAWMGLRGIDRPVQQVIVTSGAQHALTVLLMMYAAPGMTVMAEALTYPAFNALAERFRLNVVGLPMDREGIVPEAFREACEAGGRLLYCTPTLQNPTAALMSAARRADIAAIAEEFEVLVFEDDVHGMLPRESAPALSALLPTRSFYISSLSKVVAPGLRTAYVAAPDDRAAAQVTAGVSATAWMAVPLTTEIATRWIRDGVALRLLSAHQSEANRRQAVASAVLAPGTWQSHPESFHGWLTLSEGWSTAEFVMQARRQGIIIAPSDAFATTHSASPAAIRLSVCAAPSEEILGRALRCVRTLLDHGPNTTASLL